MIQKISFITTVFNEEKNVENFINSVLNQSKKPNEIVIVDGGSTDKTIEIMKKMEAKSNVPIKIIVKKKANIALGRNIAIKNSKYDLIFVSDAGCVLNKDWIKETLKFFPKSDVVAGNYKAIVKNKFEFFQSKIVIKEVDRPSRMSSRNIAFKKDCWKKVGGYPEESLTGEDTGFNLKLTNSGCNIKINPRKDVAWEMRPTLIKFAKQFYIYGKGDQKQGNLRRMKKNLIFVVGSWIYLAAIFFFLSFIPLISLVLFIMPIIYLLIKGVGYFIKTKKISALVYVPFMVFIQRISYVLGASFG